jgi:hypothetical protein
MSSSVPPPLPPRNQTPPFRPSIRQQNRNWPNTLVKWYFLLLLGGLVCAAVIVKIQKIATAPLKRRVDQEASEELNRIKTYLPSIQEKAFGMDIAERPYGKITVLKAPTPTIAEVEDNASQPDFVDDRWGPGTQYARPTIRLHYLMPFSLLTPSKEKRDCWERGAAKPTAGGNNYLAISHGCIAAVSRYTFVFVNGRLDTLIQDDGVEVRTSTTTSESRSIQQRVEAH